MISIYVKTHNKTGLKYLGKTEQDPFKYSGSGRYWKKHLRVHGKDVTTEVIKECQDEVKEKILECQEEEESEKQECLLEIKEESQECFLEIGEDFEFKYEFEDRMLNRDGKPGFKEKGKLKIKIEGDGELEYEYEYETETEETEEKKKGDDDDEASYEV